MLAPGSDSADTTYPPSWLPLQPKLHRKLQPNQVPYLQAPGSDNAHPTDPTICPLTDLPLDLLHLIRDVNICDHLWLWYILLFITDLIF